jgi:hypothetical protein
MWRISILALARSGPENDLTSLNVLADLVTAGLLISTDEYLRYSLFN